MRPKQSYSHQNYIVVPFQKVEKKVDYWILMAVRAVAAAVVLFRCDDSPRTKPSVDGDFAYVCPAQLASWHTHCSAEGLLRAQCMTMNFCN